MPAVPLPIANGFYVSDSLPVSHQECVGWYPNLPQAPALEQAVLFGTGGIEQIVTTGSVKADINRGGASLDGVPYFVNGGTLYRIETNYTASTIGTITGSGRVSMASNGTQLMIVVPGATSTGYIYSVAGGLVTITDVDFKANGEPQHVVFIDSFFVCTTDSKKFIKSDANDGTSWNALDFGTAEADPDDIVAPIVFNNQLFIGGGITIEGFSDQGGADFPFQRTGLFLDKGIFAPFSIVGVNNTFMFVGGGENESPAVWMLAGNTPQKVSTTAIDVLLGKLTDVEVSEVFAWSYAQKGAYFVGFTLPTTTIVFDTISGLWHERKSTVENSVTGNDELLRYRVNSLVSAYGVLMVADSQDGRIGILDEGIYSEYENIIFRRFSTQPFQNNMQAFFVPSVELTIESGVGNADCPDPQIRMDVSRDSKTWSDEKARSMGKIGEFNKRQIWRRLGRVARFDVFRFTMTEKVKPVVIQLTADIVGAQ